MMRGIIVVITAGLSVALLKRKQFLHHWVSLMLIVFGVALVGVVGIIESQKSDQNITTVEGIILLLLSQLFISLQLISEEKILHGYSLDPFFLVGMEGFWGLVYFAISLPILQHIQVNGKPVEDSMLAFQQLGDHKQLLIEALCIVLSIGSFNVCGICVTKYASAAQRSTIDTSRTLLIWLVSMFLGWEKFLVGQFFGFVVLSIGTLVYNEILVIPIDAFRRNTKDNRMKQVSEDKRGDLIDMHQNAIQTQTGKSSLKNASMEF